MAKSSFYFDDLDATMNLVDYYNRPPGVVGSLLTGLKNVTIGLSGTLMRMFHGNNPAPVVLEGDGPSKYYDPVRRVYVLGNTGQIFTFYAELGLIGLLMGYWILWTIARAKRHSSGVTPTLLFLSSVTLTITTSVMSDASIMLAYNLFLSTSLIAKHNG